MPESALKPHKTGASSDTRLTILCYHAICAEERPLADYCFLPMKRFAAQMRWLRRSGMDVLPLHQALEAQRSGELRRDSVALTFDDGYRNNCTLALPLLQRLGFHATVFLTTGLIGSGRLLWPNRIVRALEDTTATGIAWNGVTLAWTDMAGRSQANAALQRQVKAAAPDDPERTVAEIERDLGVAVDPEVPPDSPFAMLSQGDISAAVKTSAMSFGAHTLHHPILSALTDDRVNDEILGSILAVEALTGAFCRGFAYPNGRAQDFDERAVAVLRGSPVEYALTTIDGAARRETDRFLLPRWTIGGGTGRAKLWGRFMRQRLERRR